MLIGVGVLLSRKRKTAAYLPLIVPIIIYSVYCLISVSWAPYHLPAFKRWTKDVGDVVVALIVVTDPQPLIAVRRLFSRLGFILLPFSIALIRYTTMGRSWDDDGNLAIVGVTDNKNMLGLICFVLTLGTFWNLRWLFMNRAEPNRTRKMAAQGILLACGVYLLDLAHSSTSLACCLLGVGLILATHLRAMKERTSRVHVLCLAIVLAGGGALAFGGMGDVAGALGRDASLSGRTFMWSAMLGAVSNPMIGVGFDSFWTSPNAEIFHNSLKLLHWYHPETINEAHNGYLEVFLNLGWIGVGLISLILVTGYLRACKSLRRHRELASLMLAFIMSGAIYSITEAGFRTLSPIWIFTLLAVVGASGVNAGLFGSKDIKKLSLRSVASGTTASQEFRPEEQTVTTVAGAGVRSSDWLEQTVSQRAPSTIR
jgi:O-antigen ligase